MITATINVYDEYVAITGDDYFNPVEWQCIADWYNDHDEVFNLDDDGDISDHWSKYDSIYDAAKSKNRLKYKKYEKELEDGSIADEDDFEKEIRSFLEDITAAIIEMKDGTVLVMDEY